MIGIVTESDIVKKVVGSDRSPYFIPVEDIMSSPIVGIEERRPLTEAADLMNKYQTHHLGVTKGEVGGGHPLQSADLLRPALHRRILAVDTPYTFPHSSLPQNLMRRRWGALFSGIFLAASRTTS